MGLSDKKIYHALKYSREFSISSDKWISITNVIDCFSEINDLNKLTTQEIFFLDQKKNLSHVTK